MGINKDSMILFALQHYSEKYGHIYNDEWNKKMDDIIEEYSKKVYGKWVRG